MWFELLITLIYLLKVTLKLGILQYRPLFVVLADTSSSSPRITHCHPIALAIILGSMVYYAELVLGAFGESLVGHSPWPTTVASLDIAHLAGGVVAGR